MKEKYIMILTLLLLFILIISIYVNKTQEGIENTATNQSISYFAEKYTAAKVMYPNLAITIENPNTVYTLSSSALSVPMTTQLDTTLNAQIIISSGSATPTQNIYSNIQKYLLVLKTGKAVGSIDYLKTNADSYLKGITDAFNSTIFGWHRQYPDVTIVSSVTNTTPGTTPFATTTPPGTTPDNDWIITLYKDYGAGGTNIEDIPSWGWTLETAKQKCKELTNCKGFTHVVRGSDTSFYFKQSFAGGMNDNTGATFYTKVVPTTTPGATPFATTPPGTTPFATTPGATSFATTPFATTPFATTPGATSFATTPGNTPGTQFTTTPFATTPGNTPGTQFTTTSFATTPFATTPGTTSISTTSKPNYTKDSVLSYLNQVDASMAYYLKSMFDEPSTCPQVITTTPGTTCPPLPKCPTPEPIKCVADFGTNIGEPLSGGQGVLQNTRNVCPNTLKKCSHFKCGSAFGTCTYE